jgi:quinol monooxygenase YgiN
MFVIIRKTGLAGPPAQAVQGVRDHIRPLVQGRPGFLGYFGFVDEAGDAVFSVSICTDRDSAMDTHRRVRDRVAANMRDLLPEEPEVMAGETVFHAIAQPQDQKDRQHPLFVVLRTYAGLSGETETMHSIVSERTLPAITQAPGFRGFYAFRDEGDPNRAISVTLFDSREAALRSHEEVVGIMREMLGELAYNPPQVMMGETVVLATAG